MHFSVGRVSGAGEGDRGPREQGEEELLRPKAIGLCYKILIWKARERTGTWIPGEWLLREVRRKEGRGGERESDGGKEQGF